MLLLCMCVQDFRLKPRLQKTSSRAITSCFFFHFLYYSYVDEISDWELTEIKSAPLFYHIFITGLELQARWQGLQFCSLVCTIPDDIGVQSGSLMDRQNSSYTRALGFQAFYFLRWAWFTDVSTIAYIRNPLRTTYSFVPLVHQENNAHIGVSSPLAHEPIN